MTTYQGALADGRQRLAAADIASAALDSRILLKAATGVSDTDLIARGDSLVPEAPAAHYRTLLDRRVKREPVAQIIGEREFYGLILSVTGAVLSPRPESELLVDRAVAALTGRAGSTSLCDLGTGSGALLVAILDRMPSAQGLGVDISADALAVARANAKRAGVAGRAVFAGCDFCAGPLDLGALAVPYCGPFDCIVANPPYVRTSDLDRLEPEVALFEPRLALDGGVDGLDAYRRVMPHLGTIAKSDGVVVLEIGVGQDSAVADLLADWGFGDVETYPDLAGIARCVTACKCGR